MLMIRINCPVRVCYDCCIKEVKKHFQLLVRCHQDSMETIIMRRKWGWIGHVLRKDAGNITHSALQWTPQGKWKRGTSKNTWRWTAEGEIKTLNHTWEAGPEQTGVEGLHCRPSCQRALRAVSKPPSEVNMITHSNKKKTCLLLCLLCTFKFQTLTCRNFWIFYFMSRLTLYECVVNVCIQW